jgi:hypothetical protein
MSESLALWACPGCAAENRLAEKAFRRDPAPGTCPSLREILGCVNPPARRMKQNYGPGFCAEHTAEIAGKRNLRLVIRPLATNRVQTKQHRTMNAGTMLER